MDNLNYIPSATNEGQPMAWHEVWTQVVTRPSRDTFRRILADPTAKPQRAFIWVAVVSLIFGVLQAVIYMVLGIDPMKQLSAAGLPTQVGSVAGVICGAIAAPIVAVLGLAIGAGILRLIASLMGGQGKYGDLVYALGAVSAPVSIVSFLISLISTVAGGGMAAFGGNAGAGAGSILSLCLAPFGLALAVYAIFLDVLAIDTVEKFGTGKAVVTVLIPVILLIILGVCVAVGATALIFNAVNQ